MCGAVSAIMPTSSICVSFCSHLSAAWPSPSPHRCANTSIQAVCWSTCLVCQRQLTWHSAITCFVISLSLICGLRIRHMRHLSIAYVLYAFGLWVRHSFLLILRIQCAILLMRPVCRLLTGEQSC